MINKILSLSTRQNSNGLPSNCYYITIMGLLVEPTEIDPLVDNFVFQCLDKTFDDIDSISEVLTLQQIATFNTFVMNRQYSTILLDENLKLVEDRSGNIEPLSISLF